LDRFSTLQEDSIKIVKADGSIGSSDKSTNATLPSSDTYVFYGGSSDLWGETWSVSDINDTDFGVVISIYVDGGGRTEYLKATNFGLSVPAGATVDGIEVKIEQKQEADGDFFPYAYVDHIQIKVYYTESSTPTVGVKYPLPAFKRASSGDDVAPV
jgi:hypothetical protein